MLGYGCVGHCQGGEDEAKGYTGDGPEGDADFAKGRVDEAVDDGDEDYDGEGVDVLHDVVGDAVELHCAGYIYIFCFRGGGGGGNKKDGGSGREKEKRGERRNNCIP